MNDIKYPTQWEGTPFNYRTAPVNNIPGPSNMPPRMTPLFQSELKRASRPPVMAPTPKSLHEKVKATLHKPWLNLKMARTVSADYQNDLVTAFFVANKLIPSFEEFSKQCDEELEQILNKRPVASLKTKIDVRPKTLEELQDGFKSAPLPPSTLISEVPRRRKRAKVQTLGRLIGNLKRMHHALNPRLKSKLTRWNVEHCFVPMIKLPESERMKYIEELAEFDLVCFSSESSPAPSMDQDAEIDKRVFPNEESSDASEIDKMSEHDKESVSSKHSVKCLEETDASASVTPQEKKIVSNNIANHEKPNSIQNGTNDCFEKNGENELNLNNGNHHMPNSSADVNSLDTDIQEVESKDFFENDVNVPSHNVQQSSLEDNSSTGKRRRSSSLEEASFDMNDVFAGRRSKKKKTSSLKRSLSKDNSDKPCDFSNDLNFKTSNDCDSYASSPSSLDFLSGRKTPPLKIETPDDVTDFFLPDISDLDILPRKESIQLEESLQNYLARANRTSVPPVLKNLKYS